MDQVQFSTTDVVQEIDNVLSQLNELASSDVSASDFYQQFLLQVSSLLGGAAAAVWWIGPRDTMHLARHLGIEQVCRDRVGYQREAKRLLALSAAAVEQVHFETDVWSALSVPLISAGQRCGFLAVYQGEKHADSVSDGQLRFLTAVAEIAVEFEFHSSIRQRLRGTGDSQGLEKYLLSVYRNGSIQEVAHRIACDGRVFLGSDRLSVLMRHGRRAQRLVACGGSNAPERRSRLVRSMEQLVSAVCCAGEALVIPSDGNLLPPQIEGPLEAYLDESATRSLTVVPLAIEGKEDFPLGAIVVESFELEEGVKRLQEIETVARHATRALARAHAVGSFPTNVILGATKPLRMVLDRRHIPLWSMGLIACMAIAFCMSMIPISFRVTVPGVLRPSNRSYVFANHDGFVDELKVRHGLQVQQGDELFQLTSPDLDLEIKRVQGDLQTHRQQLDSIVAERLQLDPIDRRAEQRASELSSGALTAREKIRSLEVQFQLLTSERKRLLHTSPIDGTVLDWALEEKLQRRRIREGQRILEVAQLNGPWHLELAIPDHRVGHVLSAMKRQDELDVSFVVENEATTTVHGMTRQIATATQMVNGIPSVLLEVDFDKQDLSDLRPNASVIAKIHCGRRSIAFVWLHEFYEELRRRFF